MCAAAASASDQQPCAFKEHLFVGQEDGVVGLYFLGGGNVAAHHCAKKYLCCGY